MTEDDTDVSRRGLLVAMGSTAAVLSGGMRVVDDLYEYEVDNVGIDGSGNIVKAGATEASTGVVPLPDPLALTAWVSAGAYDSYPHGFVEAVGPDGDVASRRLLSNPSPTELLKHNQRYYRVETAQVAGEHTLRLADGENEPIETATITVTRRGDQ